MNKTFASAGLILSGLLLSPVVGASRLDCVLTNGQGVTYEKVSVPVPASGFIEAHANKPEYSFISAVNNGQVVYAMILKTLNGQTARALAMGSKGQQEIDVRLSYGGSYVLKCAQIAEDGTLDQN